MTKRFAFLLVLVVTCFAVLGGCDSSAPTYATHIVPTVAILSPNVSAEVEQGDIVMITYIDSCPSGPGHTDLLADCDGDLVTDGDQYAIAWQRPAVDGVEQSVAWDTMHMPEGTYFVVARTDDGVVRVTDATAGVISIRRNPPPAATVRFPPDRCLTDAATITVTGNASDASGVQSVTVDGVPVDTDNNFATWSVEVPLAPGDNMIMVRTMDVLGFEDTAAAVVLVVRAEPMDPTGNGPMFTEPCDLAFDALRNRLFVSDMAENRIYTVDVRRGERDVLSDDTHYGPVLDFVSGLAFDPSLGEVYVGNKGTPGEALVVYPDGSRAMVSGPTKGAGDDLGMPLGVALDLGNGRMYAATEDALFEIDRVSGDRTLLYSGTSIVGVDYDASGDLLLFAEGNRIRRWDGAAQEFSGPAAGAGPEFNTVVGVRIDAQHNRAFASDVIDYENAAVFTVRLDNGDRAILSGYGVGHGPAFGLPFRTAYDSNRNVLYVTDYWHAAIYAVEINSGDRVVLSR